MASLQTLLEVAAAHNFFHIKESLSCLQQPFPLQVGILGDFNAGKSTLLNAMLGRKLLPAMDRPTTSSITEVRAASDISSTHYFLLQPDGSTSEITPLEFAEIATGKKAGHLLVKVPSQGLLQEGFCFVDTPGLSSLHKQHTDITFGYLPFLDGVILCQDINKGGLTDSFAQFMKKPEVAEISEGFLFVLTRADQKPSDAVEKIKQETIETLSKLFPSPTIPFSERVLCVSALQALETSDASALKEFQLAFQRCFVGRKTLLWQQRQEKEAQRIQQQMLFLLEQKKNAIQLTHPELEKKRLRAEEAILQIQEAKKQEEEKLRSLKRGIQIALQPLIENYAVQYEICPEEELPALSRTLGEEIDHTLQRKISRHLEDFSLPSFQHVGYTVQSMAENANSIRDLASTATTAIIVAALSGGTGLVVNAAEAGAAGAAQVAVRAAATAAASNPVVENSASGWIRGILQATGNLFHQINPVNHIAGWICQTAKAHQARQLLETIVQNVAEQTHEQLHEYFSSQVFLPLEQQAKECARQLHQIEQEKEASEEEKRTQKRNLSVAIQSLSF